MNRHVVSASDCELEHRKRALVGRLPNTNAERYEALSGPRNACIWALKFPGEPLTPRGLAVVALASFVAESPRIGACVALVARGARNDRLRPTERITRIEASHFKPSKHGEILVRLFF